MRKKFFNFDRLSSQNAMIPDNCNEPIIETLLKDSLKENYLSVRLRQSNLLSDLREYAEIAIKDHNFYQTKFLLTIIIKHDQRWPENLRNRTIVQDFYEAVLKPKDLKLSFWHSINLKTKFQESLIKSDYLNSDVLHE